MRIATQITVCFILVGIFIPTGLAFATHVATPDTAGIAAARNAADCTTAGGHWEPSISDGDSTGGTCGTGATPRADADRRTPESAAPVVCDAWWKYFVNFLTCTGRALSVYVGTTLIWLAGWVLSAAGAIFNWGIENAVVNFSSVIYSKVAPGVNAVWTAFRDIANIIIIGIFVFVAIELILGTTTFGGRKMIAKVLIIAVLINFSLLFARIIVEAGNFLAGQFYRAVQIETGVPPGSSERVTTSTTPGALVAQYGSGISGKFAQLMGVTGFASTANALWTTAEKPELGGHIALMQGLLTAMVFLAAAVVFLYGTFLMLVRAVIIIVLIMTSSLAFASWLLPKSILGSFGWTEWWQSLLRSAVFGPILMIFLWATLKLGEGIARIPCSSGSGSSCGAIGSMLDSPANAGGVAAMFGYLMILGMLLVSIKVANSFSKTIGGFNFASMLTAAPFTLGNRFIAAPFMRQTLGRGAALWQKAEEDRRGEAAGRLATARFEAKSLKGIELKEKQREIRALERESKFAGRMASGLGGIAGGRMNVADVALMGTAMKKMGLSGMVAGASGKNDRSVSDVVKKQAEDAAKEAAKYVVSDGAAKDKAAQVVTEQRKEDRAQLEKMHKEALKGIAEERGKRDTGEIERLERQQREAEQIQRNAIVAKSKPNADMRGEDKKIADAREKINLARNALRELNRPTADAEQKLASAQKALKEFDDQTVQEVERTAKEIRNSSVEAAAEIAPSLVQRSILGVPVRGVSSQSLAGQEASGKLKGRIKSENLRAQLAALREADETPKPPANPK